MRAKVLVTGGCGFVGSHLVRRLTQDFDVVILDNLSSGRRENIADLEKKVKLIVGDIRDTTAVKKAIKNCKYLFHLAAQVSVQKANKNPQEDASNNIMGTINLLENAKKCQKIVIYSSAAVYGEPNQTPISEDHPKNPINTYGASKLASETYANLYHKTHGLPVTILRPFNIYGPGQRRESQYSGVITIFAEKIGKGENPVIYGDGTQTRDFIYIDDVVEASIIAAESEKATGQTFNVGTGKATTINELAHKMIQIAGKKLKPVHTKPRMGEIKHSVADITKIQKTLGYKPKTDLSQGLEKTIKQKTQWSKPKQKSTK